MKIIQKKKENYDRKKNDQEKEDSEEEGRTKWVKIRVLKREIIQK